MNGHSPPPVAHAIVDWGTSSFRLWAVAGDGSVLAERRSAEGAVAAASVGFEPVLEGHLQALGLSADVPVMICGMAGSRAGWIEAPYLPIPVDLNGLAEHASRVPCSRRVRVLPGIAQHVPTVHDVMRGEETMLLALPSDGRSLVCLPGTHSKWVRLNDRRVEGFSTFMTGEMFDLLRTRSVLSAAVTSTGPIDPESSGFVQGVSEALDAPALASNLLFRIRAAWLLDGTGPDALLARMSGTLIGLELAGARHEHGDLSRTVLIASGTHAALYRKALDIAGAENLRLHDAEDCVRQGLHAAATGAFSGAQGVIA